LSHLWVAPLHPEHVFRMPLEGVFLDDLHFYPSKAQTYVIPLPVAHHLDFRNNRKSVGFTSDGENEILEAAHADTTGKSIYSQAFRFFYDAKSDLWALGDVKTYDLYYVEWSDREHYFEPLIMYE